MLSLRQLGLSLEEIAGCLDRPGFSAMEVIRLHVARLRDQITWQRRLCDRLEAIAARLQSAEEVSADDFIRTIEEITMIESYYTPEQLETLKARGEAMGQDRIQQSQEDWAELIAAVRAERDKGTAPTDPEVLGLARRWMDLVNAFTGADPGIERSLGRRWQERGDTIASQHGSRYDPRDVMEYIGQAIAAAKGEPQDG